MMRLKVVTGSFSLGKFISDKGLEATWLEEKVEGWVASVLTL